MQGHDKIADGLTESGFAVVDHFLSGQEVADLRRVIAADEEADKLRKAGIGAQHQFQVDRSIRGDYIRWVDPKTAAPATEKVLQRLRNLMEVFNRELFLGLKDLELHFAKYPPGSYYLKHVDQFQQTSNRILSVVMYLNADWAPGDGGELKIYLPNEEEVVVEPLAGRLVCFRSDTVPHEVLTAHRERYSLTGWLLNQPVDIPYVHPVA